MTIIWPTVLPMIVFLWMGIPIISCSYIHAARVKVITFLFLFLWLRLCISMSSLGKGWLPGSPKPWIVTLPLSTCLATCIVFFVMIELVVLFNLIAISQPTQVPGNDSQCYFDLVFFKVYLMLKVYGSQTFASKHKACDWLGHRRLLLHRADIVARVQVDFIYSHTARLLNLIRFCATVKPPVGAKLKNTRISGGKLHLQCPVLLLFTHYTAGGSWVVSVQSNRRLDINWEWLLMMIW